MGYRFSARNAVFASGIIGGVGISLARRIDDDTVKIGAIVIFLALAVASWVYLYVDWRRGKRVARFAAWQEPPWQYSDVLTGYEDRFQTYPFGMGKERHNVRAAMGVATGGWIGFVFEHVSKRWGGRYANEQLHGITLLELPEVLPDVILLPNDSIESAKVLAGARKQNFELYEFNKAWRATGPDAKFVHDFVHPRMIETVLALEGPPKPIIMSQGAMYTFSAQPPKPEQIAIDFANLAAVAHQIPYVVWLDRGQGPKEVGRDYYAEWHRAMLEARGK